MSGQVQVLLKIDAGPEVEELMTERLVHDLRRDLLQLDVDAVEFLPLPLRPPLPCPPRLITPSADPRRELPTRPCPMSSQIAPVHGDQGRATFGWLPPTRMICASSGNLASSTLSTPT